MRDALSRKVYIASTVAALLMICVIGVLWSALPKQVPLFFTYPWGEARLAPRQMLFLLPGMVLMIVVVNNLVAKGVRTKSIMLSRMLSVIAGLAALMLMTALFGVVQSIL